MTSLVPEVQYAVHHDRSNPLRELAPEPLRLLPAPAFESAPALELPKTETTARDSLLPSFGRASVPVQTSLGVARMPQPMANFEGISNRNGAIPPDPSGDIGIDSATGKRYYFQWVNLSYQAWDVSNPASPVSVLGPLNGSQMWKNFGGPCELTNHGDPIVLFDAQAERWFVSQFSINGPYYQCIAVSQSGDPTGAWNRYAFAYDSVKLNDYPKFGIWPDGYYMTANQFRLSGSTWAWAGQGVVVFEREKMLAGLPARQVKFDLLDVNYNYGGMMPSDLDGVNLPPAGAPNPFIEWDDGDWFGGLDAVRVWNFHVDWSNTALSTIGVGGDPNFLIPTANVSLRENGIVQPNTTQRLDALGDRLMYRSQYRNFGSHQSLVSNHTVDVAGVAGIHWFELRLGQAGWGLYQEGVYAPDADSRWMGSAALDGTGNLAIGFSLSSSSTRPQIRYTGRLVDDPLNLLTQSEVTVVASTASQTGGYRWGDYSMLTVDPHDDCTFWYTQQYTAGGSAWRTRIASFRYPSCTAPETGYLSGVISAAGGPPLSGVTISSQSYQTVSGADGRYRLALPPGTHAVTYSLAGYLPHIATVTISAEGAVVLDVVLEQAEEVTLQGVVQDAADHPGLPVYARVDISGYPGSPVFSDPLTGIYKVTLSEQTDYTLVVTAVSGGYLPVAVDLSMPAAGPADPDLEQNFAMQPNLEACAPAPGYAMSAGFMERFTAGVTPAGWVVLDLAGAASTWQFNNPAASINQTGGSGLFAEVNDTGAGVKFNTALVSPLFDFSNESSVQLSFRSDIENFDNVMRANIDVSVDGGQTWDILWEMRITDHGPKQYILNLSNLAAGQPTVRFRFRASTGSGTFFMHAWQLDDVQLNDLPQCVAQPGALLVGTVKDANTSLPLIGALLQAGSETAASSATPLDALQPDGFYQLWVPQAVTEITASNDRYAALTQPVSLAADSVTWQDLALLAGALTFQPSSLDASVVQALSLDLPLLLSNSGGSAADFSLLAVANAVPLPQPSGPFAENTRLLSPKRIHAMDASSLYSPGQPVVTAWPNLSLLRSWNSGQARTWGLAPLPDGSLWVGAANRLELNRYTTSGSLAGVSASQLPWVDFFGADLAYQPLSGNLWQVNVGGDNCVVELAADSGQMTGRKICPSLGSSQRGLAYDPLSGTFYSGSWTDGILNHFDASGRLLDSYATGLNLAGLAYHPVSKHLYALVNAADGADVYVLDAAQRDAAQGDAAHGYQVLGGFNIEGMTPFGQSGLEFAADGHLWALDGVSGQVFELAVGEPRADAWIEVAWLTVQPAAGSLAAGDSQALTVHIDSSSLTPGTYQAYLLVTHTTPYQVDPLPVNLIVTSNGVQRLYYLPLMNRSPLAWP